MALATRRVFIRQPLSKALSKGSSNEMVAAVSWRLRERVSMGMRMAALCLFGERDLRRERSSCSEGTANLRENLHRARCTVDQRCW